MGKQIVRLVVMASIIFAAMNGEGKEEAAIRQTALDYIEGWYEGNAERMERALHPELAKRIVNVDQKTGRQWVGSMGATNLIQSTRAGYGTKTPKEMQQKDVAVLDVFGNAAK